MFGFIKGLFTSSPDKVFDAAAGIGNWIDGQQFTEQEKSEASFKALEYKLKWLNATQGMNLARRYISMMFCVTFLLSFIICLLSVVFGHWLEIKTSDLIMAIIALCDAFKIGWITMTIIVFYFGKGIAENIGVKK
jgi:hypothetical protein|tara:strand:+ start:98 stop:502 length:405 start_codon:yes stop_codon:yes gene_type:complete